jgi:hypothetical protein
MLGQAEVQQLLHLHDRSVLRDDARSRGGASEPTLFHHYPTPIGRRFSVHKTSQHRKSFITTAPLPIFPLHVLHVVHAISFTVFTMRFTTAIFTAALATSAYALALPTRRADTCAGLNGVNTISGSFTLAALNTTLPNANTTGSPLYVGGYLSVYGYSEYHLSVRHDILSHHL